MCEQTYRNMLTSCWHQHHVDTHRNWDPNFLRTSSALPIIYHPKATGPWTPFWYLMLLSYISHFVALLQGLEHLPYARRLFRRKATHAIEYENSQRCIAFREFKCIYRMRGSPGYQFLTVIWRVCHLLSHDVYAPRVDLDASGRPTGCSSVSGPEELVNVLACDERKMPESPLCKGNTGTLIFALVFGKWRQSFFINWI